MATKRSDLGSTSHGEEAGDAREKKLKVGEETKDESRVSDDSGDDDDGDADTENAESNVRSFHVSSYLCHALLCADY